MLRREGHSVTPRVGPAFPAAPVVDDGARARPPAALADSIASPSRPQILCNRRASTDERSAAVRGGPVAPLVALGGTVFAASLFVLRVIDAAAGTRFSCSAEP